MKKYIQIDTQTDGRTDSETDRETDIIPNLNYNDKTQGYNDKRRLFSKILLYSKIKIRETPLPGNEMHLTVYIECTFEQFNLKRFTGFVRLVGMAEWLSYPPHYIYIEGLIVPQWTACTDTRGIQ